MTIRDNTPVGIDGFHADGAHIALLAQEFVIDHMQVHQAPAENDHHNQENAQHRAIAPGFQPGSQSLTPC